MRTDGPPRGFLGLPVAADLEEAAGRVAVLGVPHGSADPDPGATSECARTPAAVRERSQRHARFLGHWDFDLDAPLDMRDVVDAGDVPGDPRDASGNSRRTIDA